MSSSTIHPTVTAAATTTGSDQGGATKKASMQFGFHWTAIPMAIGVVAAVTIIAVSILLTQNLQICMGAILLVTSLVGLYLSTRVKPQSKQLDESLTETNAKLKSLDSEIKSKTTQLSEESKKVEELKSTIVALDADIADRRASVEKLEKLGQKALKTTTLKSEEESAQKLQKQQGKEEKIRLEQEKIRLEQEKKKKTEESKSTASSNASVKPQETDRGRPKEVQPGSAPRATSEERKKKVEFDVPVKSILKNGATNLDVDGATSNSSNSSSSPTTTTEATPNVADNNTNNTMNNSTLSTTLKTDQDTDNKD